MAFDLRRLDTRIPPLWEGIDDFAADPHIDDDTRTRWHVGSDHVNQYTSQRVQGDLHKRDLVGEENLQRAADFLATRTGLRIGAAAVRLAAGDSIMLGRLAPPVVVGAGATPVWYLTVGELFNLTDSTPGFLLEVVNAGSSAVVYTKSSYSTTFTATNPATDLGPALAAGTAYFVRVTNNTGARRVFSASVAVQPSTQA